MPQTTATVTPCVKPVEELRSVEISFEDHEFYAGQKLVASITHDDDLTQPWIVMVNGEEIHRANTFKRCHSYITWHYQGLPKNKLFQEKQETGFIKNDNHFKGEKRGCPRQPLFSPSSMHE
jgi:hypothetical protein